MMRRAFGIFMGVSWIFGGLNTDVFASLTDDPNAAEQAKQEYKAMKR